MSKPLSVYLDFIRFFAAFLVVIYHGNTIYNPGYTITTFGHEAVVIFFVLSGFVIAYVAENKEHSMRAFLIARAARIYSVAIPALILTILLDFVGFSISENAYPVEFRAWDYGVLRAGTSAVFLNEIWLVAIQLYSNVPYWSMNYEVWYYIVFAVVFYLRGPPRWILFGLIVLFVGPKIVLLMPIWWMGVWVYRSPWCRSMTTPLAILALIASIAGFYVYIKFGIAHMGWDFVKAVVGEYWHTQLSFSRQFVSDYFLGAVLMLHFAAMRILLAGDMGVPMVLERVIAFFAGATFSLYLFHQPLLLFFSAVLHSVESLPIKYSVIITFTVSSAMALSYVTERKKFIWKRAFTRLVESTENCLNGYRKNHDRLSH